MSGSFGTAWDYYSEADTLVGIQESRLPVVRSVRHPALGEAMQRVVLTEGVATDRPRGEVGRGGAAGLLGPAGRRSCTDFHARCIHVEIKRALRLLVAADLEVVGDAGQSREGHVLARADGAFISAEERSRLTVWEHGNHHIEVRRDTELVGARGRRLPGVPAIAVLCTARPTRCDREAKCGRTADDRAEGATKRGRTAAGRDGALHHEVKVAHGSEVVAANLEPKLFPGLGRTEGEHFGSSLSIDILTVGRIPLAALEETNRMIPICTIDRNSVPSSDRGDESKPVIIWFHTFIRVIQSIAVSFSGDTRCQRGSRISLTQAHNRTRQTSQAENQMAW